MRRLVTTAAMLVMVLAVSSDAFAQRDSGAKARGDNDGFWSPRYSHRSTGYTRQTVRRNSIFSPSISRSRRLANVPPMLGQATVNSTPVAATASARTTISNSNAGLSNVFARVGSSSSSSALKPAWMYQKTDPRRNNR